MEEGIIRAITNTGKCYHMHFPWEKGFLFSICSSNARFEMLLWILNDFCGMGYRHIQKKTWVLWHAIQSGRLLWIWHPLWIVFDIAESFCWYEHLVMMFRHVCLG